MAPKYSVCITHYNNRPTLENSWRSLKDQIADNSEVIIVDNNSDDGSEEILDQMAKQANNIRVIKAGCSRGLGRQIAHEAANGEYEIAQLDLDDVYNQNLKEFLTFYHEKCEGIVLRTNPKPVTVAPRKLISDLGGWRDLQNCEDWDLWSRAARVGKFGWVKLEMVKEVFQHAQQRTARLKGTYYNHREMIRLGRPLRASGETQSSIVKLIVTGARLRAMFMPNYRDSFNKTFESLGERYEIPNSSPTKPVP